MKKIKITGMGIVNRLGITTEEFWRNLQGGMQFQDEAFPVEFSPDFSASRLRRLNRYCRLALYAADMAWKEAVWAGREIDEFSRGTIFTTGYGPMEAQLKFCREVAKGTPDTCSPAVFTGTVPNSCVGTVCINLRCKGVSTMLLGGNPIEYSSLLLQNGQAKILLSGAVEEYSAELYKGIMKEKAADGVKLEEGCVVFSMENTEENTGYCAVEKTSTVGLSHFPVLKKVMPAEGVQKIESLLREYKNDEPQEIFGSAAGIYFDEIEKQAIDNIFPEVLQIDRVKQFAGETMGCGFSMNIAVAALCLKNGYIPASLSGMDDVAVSRLLVCGYDVAGNYMCALLSR